jgi:hypothetical protein
LSFESFESLVYIRRSWNVGEGTVHDLVGSALEILSKAK